MKRRWTTSLGAVLTAVATTLPLSAQGDPTNLRINEVMADNGRSPVDFNGGTPDVVEIFNTGNEVVELEGLALSDTLTLEEAKIVRPDGTTRLYVIDESRYTVPPKRSIFIFCDRETSLDCVEPHADFRIDSNGNEPVTLWGPEKNDGTRDIIDQVFLPPLRRDVSFGRFPDGAGGRNVPVEQAFDVFRFMPEPTFGRCISIPNVDTCPGDYRKRICLGAQNNAGGNLAPRISREFHSTNAPAADEPVEITARVRDDKEPTRTNIARVQIIYRTITNAVPGNWRSIDMMFDDPQGQNGVLTGAANGRPLDRWSVWHGAIPGQPASSRVEFYLEVEDAEGAVSTRPLELCFKVLVDGKQKPIVCDVQLASADDIGPCDSEFGPASNGCIDDPCRAKKFIPCDVPWTYAVGYEPSERLRHLVINEVVAGQFHDPNNADNPVHGILKDPSSEDPALCGLLDPPPKYCCKNLDPDTCGYDDYIELLNTSATEEIPLAGLWLSDKYFTPRIWQFPANSKMIGPGKRLIIWLDDDGHKCPELRLGPDDPPRPSFWECPDPNDAPNDQFHTNFELRSEADQIFIFDTVDRNFGVIHGVAFTAQEDNVALSLCPDGDRNGDYALIAGGSPGDKNNCPPTNCEIFLAAVLCRVELNFATWWGYTGG